MQVTDLPFIADSMRIDYVLGAALSVLLAVYLAYALLRPERF